jgi:hypothetical protein
MNAISVDVPFSSRMIYHCYCYCCYFVIIIIVVVLLGVDNLIIEGDAFERRAAQLPFVEAVDRVAVVSYDLYGGCVVRV